MTAHVVEFHDEEESYFLPACGACDWHPHRDLTGEEFDNPFFGGVSAARADAAAHNAAAHNEPAPEPERSERPEWSNVMRWVDEQNALNARATAL